MSIRVMTAVWSIDLPASEKLVLLALADCANDEGGCWPSIATIATKASKCERTVQGAIKSLESKGQLTRNEVSGKGVSYSIHPRSDCTPAKSAPPQKQAKTPAESAPKPSGTVRPKKDKPSLVARELSDDWQPAEFGADTQSRKVVDGWPPGEVARQIEHFRAHHRKNGSKWKDWQSAWSTWVLNARNFGNGRSGNGVGRYQPANDGLSTTIRAAVDVFGAPASSDQ